jgi:methylmalonyl-CoA mutase N-terminal domain/subunit
VRHTIVPAAGGGWSALETLAGAARELVAAPAHGHAVLLPPIIAAVRARATVGEISATLADVWGTYVPY